MSDTSNNASSTSIAAHNNPVTDNPWSFLRRHTAARIGLGRSGISLPTRHHLAFQLDHARARDAVHTPLDTARLDEALRGAGFTTLHAHSAAPDRTTYLQRPDLGRRLDPASAMQLAQAATAQPAAPDVAFVVADGLSALAVQRHAAPFLALLAESLHDTLAVAPVTIVGQGRVAISDEIGALLGARVVVILIGERPGLSSPDSLGLYLTYAPRIGNTDAKRNCISNIREGGMSYADAAHKLRYLLDEALARQLSGVALKDEAQARVLEAHDGLGNFLLEEH